LTKRTDTIRRFNRVAANFADYCKSHTQKGRLSNPANLDHFRHLL
jgi:hypothetical protein